ncbi:hypothetical protein EMIT0324P_21159 [Pseudomonas chlororaphis]
MPRALSGCVWRCVGMPSPESLSMRPQLTDAANQSDSGASQFKMLSLLFAVFCLKEWREVGKIVENAGASKGVGRALANQTVKHIAWRELPWAGSVSRMNTHGAMAEGSTIKVHRIYASQGYITLWVRSTVSSQAPCPRGGLHCL